MNQTRLGSLIEALFNIVVGFSINFAANLWLIPMFVTGNDGLPAHVDMLANWWMGCAFTVISLIRSYSLRRLFNYGLRAAIQRLAQKLGR